MNSPARSIEIETRGVLRAVDGDAVRGVRNDSRPVLVASWLLQLVVAAILAMASFAKLFDFTPTGSKPLADALGVGYGTVAAIGGVELLAVVLILVPRTRVLGGLLAAATMLGALFSHASVIGFSGSPAAEMWPLALLVLAAAVALVALRRTEIPLVGSKLAP
ncbi:MAG: DoxX family protein [Acidobacteriota bacterium]|nr:MAG: DoxX family protein [Acidobacteriota bacterium]